MGVLHRVTIEKFSPTLPWFLLKLPSAEDPTQNVQTTDFNETPDVLLGTLFPGSGMKSGVEQPLSEITTTTESQQSDTSTRLPDEPNFSSEELLASLGRVRDRKAGLDGFGDKISKYAVLRNPQLFLTIFNR